MCVYVCVCVCVCVCVRAQVEEAEVQQTNHLMKDWDELLWKAKDTDARLTTIKIKFTRVTVFPFRIHTSL